MTLQNGSVHRLLRAALLFALAAGCKKPAAAPAAPVAAPDAGAARESAAPPPAIDGAVIKRYIEFDRAYLAALPQRMRAMRDELAALEKGEKRPGPPDPAGPQRVLQKMTAEDARLRTAAGITQEQQQVLQDLSMALASARKGSAELQHKLDGLRAGAASLPAAEKPGIDAQLASLERRIREIKSLAGPRQRFGDAAVDAAVRHEDELVQLFEKQMSVFQEALKLMTTAK